MALRVVLQGFKVSEASLHLADARVTGPDMHGGEAADSAKDGIIFQGRLKGTTNFNGL